MFVQFTRKSANVSNIAAYAHTSNTRVVNVVLSAMHTTAMVLEIVVYA